MDDRQKPNLDQPGIKPETMQSRIFKSIEQTGIQMTPEEQVNIEISIQQHPELADAIQADLRAIEQNPSEKSRFETVYLKGFGQIAVLADGRKISFVDIGKLKGKEKDDVIGQLGRSDKIKFKEYEVQAANQIEKKIDTNIQAANQSNEVLRKRLDNMDAVLKSQIQDLQKIKGVPNPTIEELQKNAQNIPELKGANPEDITRGKYDNILFADYYVRNSQEISKNIDPSDAKRFQDSVDILSQTLGREKFDSVMQKNIFGLERPQIEARGKELIEQGYNREVIWNSDERTITFTNTRGELRVIETAAIPPRESLEKNGLRIGRTIEPISPEKREFTLLDTEIQGYNEREISVQEKTQSAQKQIQSVNTSIIESGTKDGKNSKLKQSYETYTKEKKNLLDALQSTDSSVRLTALAEMERARSDLFQDKGALVSVDDPAGNIAVETLEKELEQEHIALGELRALEETHYTPLEKKRKQQKELSEKILETQNSDESWEKNAKYNLNFLTTIGYDSLGQDGMDRVIDRLNHPNNPRRSEIGEIQLSEKLDTPKTQALTLAIASLVRSGRQSGGEKTPEQQKAELSQKSWDKVDRTDPVLAARQTQSLGFRESLIGVRRNMTQDGGSMKTLGRLDNALFGIESPPEINNSAQNTTNIESPTKMA